MLQELHNIIVFSQSLGFAERIIYYAFTVWAIILISSVVFLFLRLIVDFIDFAFDRKSSTKLNMIKVKLVNFIKNGNYFRRYKN